MLRFLKKNKASHRTQGLKKEINTVPSAKLHGTVGLLNGKST